MNKFSRKTIESIGYYVYGLRKPGTKEYFYIGKGKGNRVFSHINQEVKVLEHDPKFDLIKKFKSIGGPGVDIIRHGLTKDQAFRIESALIDVLDVKDLTNKVRGHNSDDVGLMTAKNLEAKYKGELLKFKEPAVCFKISVLFNTWTKNMSENELYEIIRGNWTVNIKKAKAIKYAFGISDNLVRGVYKINSWNKVLKGRNGEMYKRPRWRFSGEHATELESKIGCLVTNFKNHKVSGPIFYINI